MVAIQTRRFTVDEYIRMSELGILAPAERTELVNGDIITMAAKGTAHTSATTLTKTVFELGLQNQAIIRVQDPIHINNYSEPEPDIVIAARDLLAYSTHHPAPDEVLLVIEVADSSLKYDLETKAPLYATAGIHEYWVLDVIERQLHVFRQPADGRYQEHSILADTLEAAPLAFPELIIQISLLLPPKPNSELLT
ncbi:MAG: Uma2 family endonuclease [Cyanobacteria bacterium P01_A01_bin.114]